MAELPIARAAAREPLEVRTRVSALVIRTARLLAAVGKRTIAIVLFLGLWEVAPRIGLVDRTFLVPFSEAVNALVELAGDGQLWDNAQASLSRSLAGFGIAIGIGVPLGLLIGWYRPVAEFLGPLLELFRNTACRCSSCCSASARRRRSPSSSSRAPGRSCSTRSAPCAASTRCW